jgi:hypothetical protein
MDARVKPAHDHISRFVMRTIIARMILGLVALAGIPAILFAVLYIHDLQAKSRRDSFYREHKLLSELLAAATDADGTIWATRPEPAQVLLKHMRGLSAAEVFEKLSKEGLRCLQVNENSRQISCDVSNEARHEYFVHGWRLVLELDEARHVSDAKVWIAK